MRHTNKLVTTALLLFAAIVSGVCRAQQPRINTLFPIGGRAGDTVEVEIRGSSLAGAEKLIVLGKGVSGTVDPADVKVDETFKPVFQNKCASCHELRSPGNRSMTSAQWAATVDRMVKVRQAPLSADEAAKVTQYLTGLAKAGKITAKVLIARDTMPGLYEIRVATPRGISTVGLFEVGNLPELMAVNNKRDQPLAVTLPCLVNGSIVSNGERNYFKFTAKKGQRYVFNMKAFRYNQIVQEYFNPDMRLYDANGKQLVENHGYYDLDPLIDWTSLEDGDYLLEVRDLLGRGNPGDVYRLMMGSVSYDTALSPAAASINSHVKETVVGRNLEGNPTFTVDTPPNSGITMVNSPSGPQPLYISPYPVFRAESKSVAPVALPAAMTGRLKAEGESETFAMQGNGRFEFNVYATRLGAPSRVRVSVLNEKGSIIANVNGIGRNDGVRQVEMDGRAACDLQAGKAYTLKIEAPKQKDVDPESDTTGPAYVYCVEARPAAAILECVTRTSNVTIRPGLSTPVEVVLTRREGMTGDIAVTAQNLPPGVTATSALISQDRNRGWVILTGAENAAPDERPIEFVATGKAASGEITTRATPLELYRINNQPRYLLRANCLAVVRGKPDFTATLVDNGPIRVRPKKAVEVKIRIERRAGFKGAIVIQIDGLPSGWVANQEGVGPDQKEVTMIVRPDGNDRNPFLKRDVTWSPIRAIVIANVEEFEFVIGTPVVVKADRAEEEEKNNSDR